LNRVWAWLKDALSETIARAIAFTILGLILAGLTGLLSYGFSRFLSQRVTVSVALLTILSLFALAGLIAGGVPLWHLVTASRRGHPLAVDDRLENAASALLQRLTQVQIGKEIFVLHQEKEFHAETVSLLDAWETHAKPYLAADDRSQISALREDISGRSLQHSHNEAKQWIQSVKQLTDKARTRVR